MPQFNPRNYSPADIDAMLAKAPKELLQAALDGLEFMNQSIADDTFPAPCIETVFGLLSNNAATRAGDHTFTHRRQIIEYMGSNLGMCVAVLAALAANPPPCPFSGQPMCPVEPPPPPGENPLSLN